MKGGNVGKTIGFCSKTLHSYFPVNIAQFLRAASAIACSW